MLTIDYICSLPEGLLKSMLTIDYICCLPEGQIVPVLSLAEVKDQGFKDQVRSSQAYRYRRSDSSKTWRVTHHVQGAPIVIIAQSDVKKDISTYIILNGIFQATFFFIKITTI